MPSENKYMADLERILWPEAELELRFSGVKIVRTYIHCAQNYRIYRIYGKLLFFVESKLYL